MTPIAPPATLERDELIVIAPETRWVIHARVLWAHRRTLVKIIGISFVCSMAFAFTIPKRYKAAASIMPPDQQGSGAMMLAALAGRSGGLGALGTLAGDIAGVHTSTDLFIDLLHSGTVSGHLIDRFNLQHVYHKRFRVDTAKHLAHLTKITENKKSGVITIEVEDTDRVRARDLAQGYLDELNQLVVQTNTSAAHRERIFIEQRLYKVQSDLEQAELNLSQFSSNSNAVDIKEQTRAMVDAGARIQAELIVQQSGLQSLKQIYGDGNVRVRESEAAIASLQAQLAQMAGTAASRVGDFPDDLNTHTEQNGSTAELYPSLRSLPRLAVPYADLYRSVQVEEAVFQLLTQQYETARIEEAKDVPPVNIIDPPGIPEKKSFPPRLLVTLLLTVIAFGCASTFLLIRDYWLGVSDHDPRKEFLTGVVAVLRSRVRSIFAHRRGAE